MIYNFLNKKRKIIIPVSTGLYIILITLIIINSETISDQNLYYYIFSTIVQGFLSLIALLGTVVIFKIQLLENEMSNVAANSVKSIQGPLAMDNAHLLSPTEMMSELGKRISISSDTSENIFKTIHDKLQKINLEKGELRTKMVDFSIISFINIAIALIGMPLSKLIRNCDYFSICYMILNINLSIYSLFYAFRLIRSSLGYSFKL